MSFPSQITRKSMSAKPHLGDNRVPSNCLAGFEGSVKIHLLGGTLVGSVALLVARRTNDRKVAGSRPTKVVCITVLTGNRMGVNCLLWQADTPSSEL